MGRLHHAVLDVIRQRGLWGPGDAVAVAVSGGRDSVVLLDLLVATAGAHRGRLEVVTVDHGVRPGAAEDAAFVESLAASYGLASTTYRLQLDPRLDEAGLRDARYAALDPHPTPKVALGHHQQDQAETLLIAALRGAGTRGLAGMAWTDGRYVRPLLDVAPAEITRWAEHRRLTWREDPTNQDPRFLRNRVRAELIGAIEEMRPGAVQGLARAAGHLAADEALLEALSVADERTVGGALDAAWVASAPAPLVRRALLRRWPDANAARLDAIVIAAQRGAGRIEMSKNIAVVVSRGAVATEGDIPAIPPSGKAGSG